MKLLVVSATRFEIKPAIVEWTFVNQASEWLGHYKTGNAEVDLLIPGVGMMATAFHLGRLLAIRKYDLAINAGICGSFVSSVRIGDVIQVIEEQVSDLGSEEVERFLNVFDMGLTDPDSRPFVNGRMLNQSLLISRVLENLPKVKGVTVNSIPGSRFLRDSIYNPETESMEGAAFFYACLLEKIPFVQIRSVSNYVEEKDKTKWNVTLAVKNLNNVLVDFMEEQIEGLRD